MFIASSPRRIAAAALTAALAALLLAGWLSPASALAAAGPAPALARGLPSAATTPAAGPLSEVPSKTQPYAACPRPKKRHAACQAVVVPPAAQLASLAPAASPATGGIDGSGLTPAELQSAYKLPSSTAGSGETVALVDAYDDPTAEADLATYRSAYGLPACTGASGCFRKVSQTGGTNYPGEPTPEDGDWNLEESLDVDMVSAICPNCHILLVEANTNSFENLTTAEGEAVVLGATEISNSWAGIDFAGETEDDADFDHPGIPITAASGDWGFENHERGGSGPSYPATSPYVISVGGTTLASATNERGWSETTWPRSGSGCSAFEPKPSFQTDTDCKHRTGNDVAAVAEDLSVRDSSPAEARSYSWIDVGGTSASSPIIAAVEALSESAERSLGPAAFYQSPGSLFDIATGSNGACDGSYLCTAGGGYDGPTGNGTPDGALSLSAPPPPPQLSVAGQGTGAALITSSPAGIECGATCDASFPLGTKVTLSAAPAFGSTFLGWQGACSGTGACTVTLAQGAAVEADFRGPPPPSGWSAGVLARPGAREPFLAGSEAERTFYAVALSADGGERAKTIFNPPQGFCTYETSDTGGVFLERNTGSGWVADGELAAPSVDTGIAPRWANCAAFGEVTKLSGDGRTLLVGQDMSPAGAGYRCAAFVYRRGSAGWALDGTLFPAGIGPAGSETSKGCDWFGIEDVIDDSGDLIAVRSLGHVDVFSRGASGWSLEQELALPEGRGCTETIGPHNLALSGSGALLLVGEADCETGGVPDSGRVYAYSRSGSEWSLSQTIESPEPQFQNGFGTFVAMSDDGSTAAISVSQRVTGLPMWAGAAWIYEHDAAGWHARVRLTAPKPGEDGFDCPGVVAGGARIVCHSDDTVGYNARQGSLYAFARPAGGWAAPVEEPVRLFSAEGLAYDDLSVSGELGWPDLAVTDDGALIDTPIAATNIASGAYPEDRIGYEFTAPPAHSAPAITGISPSSGGRGTVVTITGTNLTSAGAVSIGGTAAAAFTVESPTQISATIAPGTSSGSVSVTTPGGIATSAESFTFVKAEDAPQVSSISPAEGSSSGETTVTIKGAHFLAGATVTIGGAASAVDVRSETELTAVTPAQPAGKDEVIVSDEAGSSSEGPVYTYIEPPVVTSISPAEGSSNGGNTVTIKGSRFVAGASVTIGGVASAVKVLSETELTAVTPAQPPGRDEVIVSDARGVSAGGPDFTYVPAPLVAAVLPAEGPTTGHTAIVIYGAHFTRGMTVLIAGRALAAHVRSETEITAKTKPEPAGSYEVVVFGPLGPSNEGAHFTYLAAPAPVVSSITPSEGPTAGGTPVTIIGSGFRAGARVTIGAKGKAASVTVHSETEITAVTHGEAPGSYEVVVTEKGERSVGGPAYTYLTQPAGAGIRGSGSSWLQAALL